MKFLNSSFFKFLILLTILLATSVFFSGCTPKNSSQPTNSTLSLQGTNLEITSSIFPIAQILNSIPHQQSTTQKNTVQPVLNPNIDPHDYDPTPRDIAKLYDTKILVINGGGIDSWITKLTPDLTSQGVILLNLETYSPNLTEDTDSSHLHSGQHDDTNDTVEDHHHHAYNPHFWLNFDIIKQFILDLESQILPLLATNTPEISEIPELQEFLTKLEKLDFDYQETLSSCEKTELLTYHSAFDELLENYGITTISLIGNTSDETLSPAHLANILDTIKQNQHTYLLAETSTNSTLLTNFLKENSLTRLPLDSMEQAIPNSADLDYFQTMYNNLDSLKTALSCN